MAIEGVVDHECFGGARRNRTADLFNAIEGYGWRKAVKPRRRTDEKAFMFHV